MYLEEIVWYVAGGMWDCWDFGVKWGGGCADLAALDLGIYSSHSMYNVINFRGIMHVYVPAVWKIRVPLGAFFSLWLLSMDRLLIRDNLGKRRSIEEKTCLFCSEDETINHLFFSLCGGKTGMWDLTFPIGLDYVFAARCWLCNKKYSVVNMLSSAVWWSL